MYSIIFIYNINIIDGHFYTYIFNSLKSLLRILLGRNATQPNYFMSHVYCITQFSH